MKPHIFRRVHPVLIHLQALSPKPQILHSKPSAMNSNPLTPNLPNSQPQTLNVPTPEALNSMPLAHVRLADSEETEVRSQNAQDGDGFLGKRLYWDHI